MTKSPMNVKVWGTSFCGEDIAMALDDDIREKFDKLPNKEKVELLENHAHRIAKGLENGLMHDWVAVMQTAISCTDLEKDILKESK